MPGTELGPAGTQRPGTDPETLTADPRPCYPITPGIEPGPVVPTLWEVARTESNEERRRAA